MLQKPAQLIPVEFDERPVLHACMGKEDGHVYYASKTLHSSPSAVAVLGAAPDLQAVYSRMPLLLSPSTPMAFPADLEVTLAPEPWLYQKVYILVVQLQVVISSILKPVETYLEGENFHARREKSCFCLFVNSRPTLAVPKSRVRCAELVSMQQHGCVGIYCSKSYVWRCPPKKTKPKIALSA